MMYQNKLVVALKANGKILREFKDTVYVPFGTEYSILIKNLNSVRAAVNVSIDGTDIGDGVSFIVDPNSEAELTRYIKNGNLDQGNRFKFIERTAGIEKHRGVQLEDGLIRIQFQFEMKVDLTKISGNIGSRPDDYWDNRPVFWKGTLSSTNRNMRTYSANSITTCANSANAQFMGSAEAMASMVPMASSVVNQVQNDVGITVPGSVSDQKFKSVSGFMREPEKHVMVLKLLGETEQGTPVIQPVTVKTKPTCITCGKVNKATAKFCTECGTSLQIV